MWIITALASGTPVFAKGLLWRRLPAPNTSGLAAAEADTVFIHSTKHWGKESIETSATVDHHRESEQCFLLNGRPVRISQYRTQCNRPATQFYYYQYMRGVTCQSVLLLTLIMFLLVFTPRAWLEWRHPLRAADLQPYFKVVQVR